MFCSSHQFPAENICHNKLLIILLLRRCQKCSHLKKYDKRCSSLFFICTASAHKKWMLSFSPTLGDLHFLFLTALSVTAFISFPTPLFPVFLCLQGNTHTKCIKCNFLDSCTEISWSLFFTQHTLQIISRFKNLCCGKPGGVMLMCNLRWYVQIRYKHFFMY